MVAATGCSDGDAASDPAASSTTTSAPAVELDGSAGDLEIAWLSTDRSNETAIFLSDGLGEGVEVVAKVPGRAEQLAWSPDGSQLLFDGDGTGDFELSVVEVGSGAVAPLAPSPSSSDGGASWSPDGERVVFFSDRDGRFAGYVVEVASGTVTRVTPESTGSVGDLSWSPDGSWIAYSVSEQVDSEVWLVRPDGSDARRISTVPGATQPAWSPDGATLAIAAQPTDASTPGIYLLDVESEEVEELADTEYVDSFPVWSPDGEFVYFTSALPNDDADGGTADDLFRVASSGGEPEAVTADGISVELEVDVAPNSRLIAFSVVRGGDKEVFVANADGSAARPLSRSDRVDAFGVWRPTDASASER